MTQIVRGRDGQEFERREYAVRRVELVVRPPRGSAGQPAEADQARYDNDLSAATALIYAESGGRAADMRVQNLGDTVLVGYEAERVDITGMREGDPDGVPAGG